MGESPTCLVRSFSQPAGTTSTEPEEGDPYCALTTSISFRRFMLESLACEKRSCFSNNQYLEEAKKSSKPGLVAQRKAYFEALYNRNGAKKPAALLEEQNAACNEPNVMEETSRDSSNPPRIPTTASANGLSVHSSTAPQEERRRSKPVDDCSVSRRRIADGKSHGIDHLKTSGVSGPKARRPTVPSPFSLRCEDRAAKRKELFQFFQKLEEKTNAKILVSGRRIADGKSHGIDHLKTSGVSRPKARPPTVPSSFSLRCEERAAKRKEFFQKLEEKTNAKEANKVYLQAKNKQISLTQPMQVKMKLVNLGHAQSEETRMKIGNGVQTGWERRSEKLKLQETCYFEWQNLIAEASRKGFVGEEEKQWDSYEILDEQLEQEWLESVEQSRKMARPKGSKRAPNSLEQRRKISEAISAKWAETCYFEWQNLIAEASRKGFVGEEEKQWDSYEILDEQLEQEWLESVEQSRKMARPKGSKRAPNSLEQRRKISEAISAKWADPARAYVAFSAENAYRDRVCTALYKYHGTPVGAERKRKRRPSSERQPRTQNPTKKKANDTDNSTGNVTESQKRRTRLRSNMPLFKDPLASSKLEMIKNIRAERAAAENKKTEAIERVKLLKAEAEKAAKALEAAATRSPLAQASSLKLGIS
ncbi:unnamed protein product [Camellia sinensis]